MPLTLMGNVCKNDNPSSWFEHDCVVSILPKHVFLRSTNKAEGRPAFTYINSFLEDCDKEVPKSTVYLYVFRFSVKIYFALVFSDL